MYMAIDEHKSLGMKHQASINHLRAWLIQFHAMHVKATAGLRASCLNTSHPGSSEAFNDDSDQWFSIISLCSCPK